MKIYRVVLSSAITFVLLSLLMLPGNARAQEYVYHEDFEDGVAQDWTLDPGWQVIQDEGNYVLSGQGHTWARSGKLYDDYRLSFRLKILGGGGHLNFRINNTGRYFIGFDARGSQLGKQYWPDTFLHELTKKSQSHKRNEWHQIEIVGQGDTLTFIVDGNTEWTYTDQEPILVGGFAFETWEDSHIYIDDIKVELAASSAFHVDQAIAALTWTRMGGPLGGLGYDIRMMPGNPDSMLVSDAYAGVFASTDGGASWLPSNTGITARAGGTGDAIPIFCLTIDPTHPNIVWVGTQNTRGIFKSTDGGANWTRKDQGVIEPEGITFRGIAVDPTNSDIVYAGAELSSWVWNQGQPISGREFDMTGGVVYKTIDGGESWAEVWRGDNLARYIWIDPLDTNVLYVSTGIFDREAANSNPQTGDPGGEGVIKSTDGGKTWANINNGLNNLYVGSLFMHPTNPDILIAGTGNVQYWENTGVYLSTNGGSTWEQTLKTDGGEPIESVEISTTNPEIVYAGGNSSIYRSEDGGQTWKRVSGGGENGWGPPGVRAGFPIDFQVDPRDPNRIFANEYGGGNFLSEDGGKTWVDASRGYTGAQVRAIAVDPNEPGRVIAAARSGIFGSYDGGINWTGLSYPPVVSMEWNAVAIDPTDPQHIVAETNWGKFLVNSRDGGITWKRAFNFGEQRVGWHAIVFAPSDPSILYAGSTGFFSAGSFDPSQPGKGIYVSNDGGDSWSPVNNTLSQDASVYGLAVDLENPQVLFAATSNHGLLKTSDGGKEWQTIQGGLPERGSTTVIINPANPSVILAGFERKALYLSTDSGQNWKPSALGMNPEGQISSVVFDPTTSAGEVIYAADAFSGVYRSSDGGQSWSAINTGLLMRSVNALAISSDGLHLYAGTEGGGTYRLDLNNKVPAMAPKPTAVPVSTKPTVQQLPTPTLNSSLSAANIVIDGNGSDWENYPVNGSDPAGDQRTGSPDLGEVRAVSDAQYFYLYIKLHVDGKTDHYDVLLDINGGEFDYQLSFWPGTSQAMFAPFPVSGMNPLEGVTSAQGDVIEVKMPLSAVNGLPVRNLFVQTYLGNQTGDTTQDLMSATILAVVTPTLEPTPIPTKQPTSSLPCGSAALLPLGLVFFLQRRRKTRK